MYNLYLYSISGEANFLGGVAKLYDVKGFDVISAKSRFFQIYLEKVIYI